VCRKQFTKGMQFFFIAVLSLGLILIALLLLRTGPKIVHAQQESGVIRVAMTGTNTNNCGNETTPCATVQFAVDQAEPGAEIHIAAGTYAGVQVRAGLTQSVYISQPLTLRGGYTVTNWAVSDPAANPTTLDAQGNGRVILIADAVRATIENVSLTRGLIAGNGLCSVITANCGGALLSTGPLTLSKVTVISNQAERAGGGVAALTTTTIINSDFVDNAAFANPGAGGGLYAEGSVTIIGSLFSKNTSAHIGGAVRVDNENERRDKNATVTIMNSQFEENESGTAGGGLSVGYDTVISGVVRISQTTFISHTTDDNGGAISAFNARLTMIDSHLKNNRALTGDGGGLHLFVSLFPPVRGSLTLTNTNLISNWANLNGGGAWTNGAATVTGGSIERNHVNGQDTASSGGGGGLSVRTLTLSGTQLISNTSGRDGGAARVVLNATLSGGRLAYNQAITDGGGLWVGGALTLTDTEFISNTAMRNGGGAYIGSAQVSALSGARFERNRANGPATASTNGGGGIWTNGSLVLNNTQFTSNIVQGNGGGAHIRGGATIEGGRFEGNQAFGDNIFSSGGGGVYVVQDLTFTATSFVSNTALQGGGIRAGEAIAGLNGLFQANRVERSGGGVYAADALILTGTQFMSNTAITTNPFIFTGGAGAFAGGETYLADVLFQSNYSGGDNGSGGGLRAAITTTLFNVQFISNTATTAGGGASLSGPSILENTFFQENSSAGSGGGLHASISFPAFMVVTNSQFLSNTAQGEGAGPISMVGRMSPIATFKITVATMIAVAAYTPRGLLC